ncbi:MAG: hypothetical protein ACOYYU_11705 [Chloroflexota bacterium]
MFNITKKFARWANGRNVIILLVVFLLFNFLVIPALYPKFETLDIRYSYTPSEAYSLIASYGDAGRQTYALTEVTLDLVYPLTTALLFIFAIIYTFQKAFPNHSAWQNLALIPLGILAADYLENACVVTMLLLYPQELPILVQISNVFTIIKFALTPFELLVFVGLIGWLVQAIRARNK